MKYLFPFLKQQEIFSSSNIIETTTNPDEPGMT